MLRRKIFLITCMITSVVSLAVGYGIVGHWVGVLVSILMIPAWLFAKKASGSWLPSICLFASIFLAAMGKLNGAVPLLMILSSGIALAVWDLLLLNDMLGNDSSEEHTRQYENKHLQSLALVLGFGLTVAFLGRPITFRVPFIVLILFIAFVLSGLDRVWCYIKKTRNN